MSLEQQAEAILAILLTAFLSMLIGLEREYAGKPAGLRTHMLIGVGACIFTVLSRYAFETDSTDRIAANIVTGVGFLGSGVIFQRDNNVHDLTTAAGIWATAAIGMAVGAGAWLLAAASTITVWTILAVMRRWSHQIEESLNHRQPPPFS